MKVNGVRQRWVWILVLVFVEVSCDVVKEMKRPRDPWVFSSVLDSKARTITAALNERMYVAYDTENCQLYKAWQEGVLIDGMGYNANNGTHPTSKGYNYFIQSEVSEFWFLVVDGTEILATTQFKGYTLKDNQVVFHFQLSDNLGHTLTVNESPEYYSKGMQSGLIRTFEVIDSQENVSVRIKTQISNLSNMNDFESDGQLAILSGDTINFGNDNASMAEVEMILNNDKSTSLKVLFHPDIEDSLMEKRASTVDVPLGMKNVFEQIPDSGKARKRRLTLYDHGDQRGLRI